MFFRELLLLISSKRETSNLPQVTHNCSQKPFKFACTLIFSLGKTMMTQVYIMIQEEQCVPASSVCRQCVHFAICEIFTLTEQVGHGILGTRGSGSVA